MAWGDPDLKIRAACQEENPRTQHTRDGDDTAHHPCSRSRDPATGTQTVLCGFPAFSLVLIFGIKDTILFNVGCWSTICAERCGQSSLVLSPSAHRRSRKQQPLKEGLAWLH